MNIPNRPAGYNAVSVYIVATGAQRVVTFLKEAFDAVELRRYDRPDGTIMHIEVRIDDTVIMLSDGSEQWPAFPVWLHLYLPDVDAAYAKALAAGGVSAGEPTKRPGDPDRRGGVKDPAGNTWWISTQVEIA